MITVISANQKFLAYNNARQLVMDAAEQVLPESNRLFVGSTRYVSKYMLQTPMSAHAEEFVWNYSQQGTRQLLGIGVSRGGVGAPVRFCPTCMDMLGMS